MAAGLPHSVFIFVIFPLFSLLCTCDRFTRVVAPFIITEEQEKTLGDRFKSEIINDKTGSYSVFKGDERVSRYVDSLGQKLAAVQNDRDGLPFTFTVLEDTTVNAFAIPGGHVFVNTGLLRAADNGAEVAGVIAHEIGHISKYHGRDLLVRQTATGYVNTILFGNDSASIAGAVTAMLENMAFLGFSRDNEYQADSCSVAYTFKAGCNPIGMRHFLRKLKDRYGEQPKFFEPFSTHPPLSDRISRVENRIGKTPGASMDADSLLHTDVFLAVRSLL